MESEGRLIFPNGRVQKASVFDRLALSNDTTTTIPPTRASFKKNNRRQLHKGKVAGGKDNNVQEPQMIQLTAISRLRLFLFPAKAESTPSSSMGSLLDDSSKSETWFVDALNSAIGALDDLPRGVSADSASVNCLLGLEDDSSVHSRHTAAAAPSAAAPADALPRPDSSGKLARHGGQDVQSGPDSPMLDKNSSFGSTSSAPSLSNLPPIRVRPDDRPPDHIASQGQLQQQQRPDEGYAPTHLPPQIPLPAAPGSTPTISPTENPNRVGVFSSDDEKSDHGGIRRPLQPPIQPKPAPLDAIGSDLSARNMYYQERPASGELNPSDAGGYRIPVTVSNQAYLTPEQLQQQYSYQQQQLQQQQHQQLQQQHQQPQKFIPAHPQYIHHPATGTFVPVPSYYPIQQSAQSHTYDPQGRPMYFVPVGQNPPATGISIPNVPAKPELPPASLYRTAAAASPSPAVPVSTPLIPIPAAAAADQVHPYPGMGYHVMHHQQPIQSSAGNPNYGYEFADPAHTQMYHSQPTFRPSLAPQFQTVVSAAAAAGVIPDGAAGESKQGRAS
ncbi:leucine-rich repeat extensin-like protein 2 [Ananas comosus]|uniref:Leucine-rich repeat extensin-like protein 2 n=1 Tax=Ananas comosus TaxID=4615 RepID=A0A6P5EZS2_ANACO|nr:leucine-rich repeat extensin-like protein 2 [Ananas comosus]